MTGAAWLAFAAHVALGLGGEGLDAFFDNVLYNVLLAIAGAACLARAALLPDERLAWSLMGGGLLAWMGGEIYYSLFLSELETVPIPSPADIGYLALYPASYVALVLLVRSRVPTFSRALWLDGVIAALAAAALAAAVALEPIIDASVQGEVGAIVVNLAYPVGDLVLLALVIAVSALSGWRPGRAWVLLGAGLVAMATADGAYLLQSARGTYVEGTLVDAWWPAAALLVGLAAWAPRAESRAIELEGLRVVLVPVACGILALVLAAAADVSVLGDATTALSLATLFAITLRMALAFRENQRMLTESRRDALTDSLTGLGNRRRLMLDLELALRHAEPEAPRVVALFDLNGFKSYNDSFGHPAGDELLARLGRRLEAAARPLGRAYRLGGDEFCVLVRLADSPPEVVMAATAAALRERGEGFEVAASQGCVVVPIEAKDVSEALQLADRRMYAHKGSGRASAGRQTRDVLLSTLRERQPRLHAHLASVAEFAVAAGRRLGMSSEELDEVARAAELHDVGKIAIPDAVLDKPGPLDAGEWSFMRRHTVIGERILAAAPALVPVARLVRSSHERWDGEGYPDGLVGESRPLGARLVAVCDAFDAMTAERPYRARKSGPDAVAELRRCAGTQFDPAVVAAFGAALEGDPSYSASGPSAAPVDEPPG